MVNADFFYGLFRLFFFSDLISIYIGKRKGLKIFFFSS